MSTSKDNRRRLTLMPEVLPTPQTALTTGSVRARTLTRLKVLAALGAAGLAASCGRIADDDGGGGSSGSSGGKGIVNGGSDGGPDAYGVVDPLPSPACFNYEPINATASYIDGDGGVIDGGPDGGTGRQVEVDIEYAQADVVLSSIVGTKNATFESNASGATTAKLLFTIADGATEASAVASVSCQSGMTKLYIDLTLLDDGVSVLVQERPY